MEIDYKAIGHRIRKLRMDKNLSQEELRYKAGVSKTHMSHIETGSTKLSLSVLVCIANSLGVGTDQLLGININSSTIVFKSEIQELIEDCDSYELDAMINAMCLIKNSIRNKPINTDY